MNNMNQGKSKGIFSKGCLCEGGLRIRTPIPGHGPWGALVCVKWGTSCPSCPSKLCYNHPSSSKRATVLAMPDVVTPTCRAISAIDNPNPSPRPFGIHAGTLLILLRRLSSLSIFAPIPPFLHSLPGAVNYIATRDTTSPIPTCYYWII